MSIADKMREYVQQHGSASTEAIADSIPELRDGGGVVRVLLLLRLNPLFERAAKTFFQYAQISGIPLRFIPETIQNS